MHTHTLIWRTDSGTRPCPLSTRGRRWILAGACSLALSGSPVAALPAPPLTAPGPLAVRLRELLLEAAGTRPLPDPVERARVVERRQRQNALLAALAGENGPDHAGGTCASALPEPGLVHALLWDRSWVMLSPTERGQRLARLLAAVEHLHTAGRPALGALRVRIEACLTAWGWHGDDGGSPRLDCLLEASRVSPAKVEAVFANHRGYLMAVLDAWAVCILQDVTKHSGNAAVRRALRPVLAPALEANLRRALNYVADATERLR